MTTYSPKFETFWTALTQRLELTSETKVVFAEVVEACGFNKPEIRTIVASSPTATPTSVSRQTGYNVFVKARNAELKPSVTDSTQRMAQVKAEWSAKSPAEKASYKPLSVASPSPATPTKRPLTGYQYYVRVQTPAHKANGVESTARMKLIGADWKKLSAPEQATYKQLALTAPPTSA